MATYTEQQLAIINQRANAVPSQQYIITTGKDVGTLYVGKVDGTLQFVTDNFDTRAQSAVGSILTDSSNSKLTYNPSIPAITPSLIPTGIIAGTYGDTTHVSQVTVDADGRITSATNVLIASSEDHKVLVSGTDTTAAFLLAKLQAGTGITLTTLNPAGNEIIKIDGTPSFISAIGNTTTINLTNTAGTLTADVNNGSITYAKIQNVTTNKLLGRATAGVGSTEEITLGSNLSFTGTTLNVTGIPSVTPAALSKTDDTNITLTLGGTPATALLQATSITVGWTGTLADGRITSASTWNAKLTSVLPDGDIFVGSAGNAATAVALSGEATIVNTGAITLTNSAVIGKVLTGYISGAGVVAATDTILGAIQKLNGNIGAIVSGVSSVSGTTNRITASPTTGAVVVDISASYVGQTSLTTLGTVTTGTLSTGAVIGGVTMTLGSDASYDTYYRSATGILTRLANGTTGQVLSATTGAAPSWITNGVGTVTSVSVVTNQGISGSVATATTTPAITLSLGALTGVTSFNGLIVTANTGAITTGSWAATPIPILYGGTGQTTKTLAFNDLSPNSTLGDITYFDGTNNVRLAGNILTTQMVLTQTGTGSVSAAPSWQPVPTAGIQTYVFANIASSIATYFQAVSLSSYSAAAVGTITTSVGTSATLMGVFATNAGFPNITTIPVGQFTVHYDTQKASGANNYYTYAEIYKRNLAGTETLIATTDVSTQTAVNTIVNTTVTALISVAISLLATDRIIVKIQGVLLTSSVNITLRFDDSTSARIELPSATVDATNFVPYTGATLGLNLGVQNFQTTGSIGLTGTRVLKGWFTDLEITNAPTINGSAATGTTGLVRATSPTLITPLLGTPTSGVLTNCTGLPEAGLSLTNITTNDVSISKHGFAPILPNDATKYLDGTGAYSIPSGGKGFVIEGEWISTSPADSSTYYAGLGAVALNITANNIPCLYVPKTCTLKAAFINVICGAASNETVTYNAYINGSATLINTDTSITTVFTVSNTSMSVSCSSGQKVFLQIVTPAWATNPTSHRGAFTLYFE